MIFKCSCYLHAGRFENLFPLDHSEIKTHSEANSILETIRKETYVKYFQDEKSEDVKHFLILGKKVSTNISKYLQNIHM